MKLCSLVTMVTTSPVEQKKDEGYVKTLDYGVKHNQFVQVCMSDSERIVLYTDIM